MKNDDQNDLFEQYYDSHSGPSCTAIEVTFVEALLQRASLALARPRRRKDSSARVAKQVVPPR